MPQIFKKQIKKTSRGFTILELMVTIFVIAVALVGGMTALQKTTALTSASSNRLIAAYMAQEGLEIIRNIRDGNWLENNDLLIPWNYGFGECEDGCIVDYRVLGNEGPSQASFQERELIKFDSSLGYQNKKGNETKFKRKITIKSKDNDILNVLVEVAWSEKGGSNSFSAQENLYNWR